MIFIYSWSLLFAQPFAGVCQDLNDLGLLEYGKGLMTGTEIEDLAVSDIPDDAAAEVFSGCPGFFEDDFVGFWNVKGFIIHFRFGYLERFWNTFCDRVFR